MGPLVFSRFGGMGHAAVVFYRRLVFLVFLQEKLSYSSVMYSNGCTARFFMLCYVFERS